MKRLGSERKKGKKKKRGGGDITPMTPLPPEARRGKKKKKREGEKGKGNGSFLRVKSDPQALKKSSYIKSKGCRVKEGKENKWGKKGEKGALPCYRNPFFFVSAPGDTKRGERNRKSVTPNLVNPLSISLISASGSGRRGEKGKRKRGAAPSGSGILTIL